MTKALSSSAGDLGVQLRILVEHLPGREPLSVTKTFVTPVRSLRRRREPQNVRPESGLIFNRMKQPRVSSHVAKRTDSRTNDGASARLCLDDWPPETLRTRRINEGDRA